MINLGMVQRMRTIGSEACYIVFKTFNGKEYGTLGHALYRKYEDTGEIEYLTSFNDVRDKFIEDLSMDLKIDAFRGPNFERYKIATSDINPKTVVVELRNPTQNPPRYFE